jgi:hypothetical protein
LFRNKLVFSGKYININQKYVFFIEIRISLVAKVSLTTKNFTMGIKSTLEGLQPYMATVAAVGVLYLVYKAMK